MRTLTLRIQAYPSDLNPIYTVFGGWMRKFYEVGNLKDDEVFLNAK